MLSLPLTPQTTSSYHQLNCRYTLGHTDNPNLILPILPCLLASQWKIHNTTPTPPPTTPLPVVVGLWLLYLFQYILTPSWHCVPSISLALSYEPLALLSKIMLIAFGERTTVLFFFCCVFFGGAAWFLLSIQRYLGPSLTALDEMNSEIPFLCSCFLTWQPFAVKAVIVCHLWALPQYKLPDKEGSSWSRADFTS